MKGASAQSALPVATLTGHIRDLLESNFRGLWVTGELREVKPHHTGHVYMALRDGEARLDAVVWKGTVATMRWRPAEGTLVAAYGRLSLYAPHGAYRFIIERLEPVGAGALDAALQALKAKLAAEGLFAVERKRPLPKLPRAVGVVTSGTGAARRDIEAVVHRRSPQIPIILYPATVQGDTAPADVARGIARLGGTPGVDVIIVGRGGGSGDDLAAFDTEIVARAIAACPVPVISAVGHETDTSIADLVADLRAPTPSAAAESAVPVRDDLLRLVDDLAERTEAALRRGLDRHAERLKALTRRLERGVSFDARRRVLDRLSTRLHDAARGAVGSRRQRLVAAEHALATQHPHARLKRAREALSRARSRLEALGPQPAATARSQLAVLAARLQALSPLASLDRGYSLTRRADGGVVRAATDVEVGDTLTTQLRSGWVSSTVTARGESAPPTEPESTP